MNAGMRIISIALGCVAVAASVAHALPSRVASPWATAAFVSSRRIDVNQINLRLINDGLYGFDVAHGVGDLIFPKGSGKTALFSAGPWLVAKVGSEWRGAIVDFGSEFTPGAMAGGTFTPPSALYRTYKVVPYRGDPQDTATVWPSAAELAADPQLDSLRHHSWSEYIAGAAPYGAPVKLHRLPLTSTPDPTDSVDVLGPDVSGDQMLWCVYNDADPAEHDLRSGSTAPLGVEIQQSFYGFDATGPVGNTVFMRLRIANRGANTLDSLMVGFWSDPDLGGSFDDHIASDSARALVYCYNGHYLDEAYGATPPAMGYVLLRGPTSTGGTPLGPYALTGPIKAQEPQNIDETVHWVRGLETYGEPRLDPDGRPRTFWFDGDPVVGAGWLDPLLTDRRMMLSTGPITMAPGDTQVVVAAIVIGQGEDNLSSVANLRCAVDVVRAFYAADFSGAPPAPACPTIAIQSCPRSVAFWQQQCAGGGLSASDLMRIAQCVDESAVVFAMTPGMEPSQFCGILNSSRNDLLTEVYRQHAAFLANVCAAKLGLGTAGADSAFLGQGIEMWSPLVGARTVGEMAAPATTAPCHCADSLLAALTALPTEDPARQEAYRAMTGELKALNYGLGLGPTCGRGIGARPSLIDATATTSQVRLRWNPGAAEGIWYAIYRQEGSTWVNLGGGIPRGASEVIEVDNNVEPGRTYHYRLSINPDGREEIFAEPVVQVPRLYTRPLMSVRPNPTPGALVVAFALLSSEPATLEIYDLRGRLMESRPVSNPTPGEHVVNLGGATLEAGIYVVRIRQGGESASAKAVIVR